MTPEGGKPVSKMRARSVRGLASLVATSLLVLMTGAEQAQAETTVHVLVSFDE